MSKIHLNDDISIDLDELLTSRLLIQANSITSSGFVNAISHLNSSGLIVKNKANDTIQLNPELLDIR